MPDEKGFFILAVILGKQLPMEKTEAAPIIRFRWRKLAIAASILLIIGLGSYFLFFNKPAKQNEVVKAVPATDVEAPKVTKATITLADGRTISIDSITSGMLSRQSNVTVTKTASGKIVYAGNADEIVYNTLNNPRGSKVIDMIFQMAATYGSTQEVLLLFLLRLQAMKERFLLPVKPTLK
ncbi:MAG: hypothetical protein WDO16_01480 [Bacteroidota bacterium]